MSETIDVIFRRALKKWLDARGWGGQAELARKSDVSSSYISDILAARRYGVEDKKRAIAKAAGFDSYEAFLDLGRDEGIQSDTSGIKTENSSPSGGGPGIDAGPYVCKDLRELTRSLERLRRVKMTREEKETMDYLLLLAQRIIESDNSIVREALKSNIVAFAEDLDRMLEIAELHEEIITVKSRLSTLEKALKSQTLVHATLPQE